MANAPRRAIFIAYTRLSEAREKGVLGDDAATLSLWFNPGQRFDRSVVFVPFGHENLDLALTPAVRYVEKARAPGLFAAIRRYVEAIVWARRLIRHENCDIVRVCGPNISAAIALPLRWICPLPMLVFIEAFWEDLLGQQAIIPKYVRAVLPWWYRIVYKAFDAYCGTPTAHPDFYVGRGMARGKIAPWRNEIDLAALDRASTATPPAVMASTRPRLVAVGRLHPEKLTLDLLYMLLEVRRHVPGASLVLVGDGPLRPQIENLSRELGIEGAVHLTGTLSNAQAFAVVRECDIYTAVMQGSALVEAMAAARPIVAYDNLPHRSYLEADHNAVFVPDRQPAAMARAVVSLLNDPVRMTTLGSEARRTAVRLYGPDAIAEAHYAGYLMAWRHHNA